MRAGQRGRRRRDRAERETRDKERREGRKKERGTVSRVFRPASAAGRAAIGCARYRTVRRLGVLRAHFSPLRCVARRVRWDARFLTSRGSAYTHGGTRPLAASLRWCGGRARAQQRGDSPLSNAPSPFPSLLLLTPPGIPSGLGARVHDMRPASVRTSHCPCRLTLGATASRAGYSPRQPRRASEITESA